MTGPPRLASPTPEGECQLAGLGILGSKAEVVIGKPNACGVGLVRLGVKARDVGVSDDRLPTDVDTGSSRDLIAMLVLAEITRADLPFGAPLELHCLIGSLNDLLPEGFRSRKPQGLVLYEEELE